MNAFPQLFLPLGAAPFHVNADGNGNYLLSLPSTCSGTINGEVVSLEVSSNFIQQISAVSCFTVSYP